MIITPKTTVEEVKTAFPNHHWGLEKINGILKAIKTSEFYNVNVYENEKGELMIYISEREDA